MGVDLEVVLVTEASRASARGRDQLAEDRKRPEAGTSSVPLVTALAQQSAWHVVGAY